MIINEMDVTCKSFGDTPKMKTWQVTREELWGVVKSMTYEVQAEDEDEARDMVFSDGDQMMPIGEQDQDCYLEDVTMPSHRYEVDKA